MNYYRRYFGDYLRDTARLSMLEHGAYSLMLDYYYAGGGALPTDREEVYRLVRAMRPEEKRAVDKILTTYFNETTNGWVNGRSEQELEKAANAIQQRRRAGRVSAENRNAKSLNLFDSSNENANQTVNETTTVRSTLVADSVTHPPNHLTSNNPPTPLAGGTFAGFGRFWKCWPPGTRKQARGKCLELWRKSQLEGLTEQILAHVESLKRSTDWRKEQGAYIPAPLVYLRQRRWEGAEPFREPELKMII